VVLQGVLVLLEGVLVLLQGVVLQAPALNLLAKREPVERLLQVPVRPPARWIQAARGRQPPRTRPAQVKER
jgi:hypothetical protein